MQGLRATYCPSRGQDHLPCDRHFFLLLKVLFVAHVKYHAGLQETDVLLDVSFSVEWRSDAMASGVCILLISCTDGVKSYSIIIIVIFFLDVLTLHLHHVNWNLLLSHAEDFKVGDNSLQKK